VGEKAANIVEFEEFEECGHLELGGMEEGIQTEEVEERYLRRIRPSPHMQNNCTHQKAHTCLPHIL